MKASIAVRVASVVSFVLFAGHSAGGLSSWSPQGPNPVLDAMRSARFPAMGFTRSYWHFYAGFGWSISIFLFAETVALWQLASWFDVDGSRARSIAALLLFTNVALTILDWFFFFWPPLVTNAAIALCLAIALLQAESRPARVR
jgi:hypothetical protein